MAKRTQEQPAEETAAPEAQNAPVAEATHCILCEDGVMKRATIKSYNQTVGVVLFIVGLVFLFLGPLGLLGVIMVFIGLYFLAAKRDVWLCDKCDAIIERR